MSRHAIEKMQRRSHALEAKIEAALTDPANLPSDWDRMLDTAGDLVERIVDAQRTLRTRTAPSAVCAA